MSLRACPAAGREKEVGSRGQQLRCPRADDLQEGGHDGFSGALSAGDQRAMPVRWTPVKVRLSDADLPWKVLSAEAGSEIENVR